METSYRSPNLISGFFNKIGTIHMHIDAPEYEELILNIIKELEKKWGLKSKINKAVDFIAGNQRKIYPKTYEAHTPNIDGKEQLDFFSTTFIRDRESAIEVVNFVNQKLEGTKGVIVELEQVVGWISFNGQTILIPHGQAVEPITESETIVPRGESLSFEIHHRWDIQSDRKDVPPQILESFIQSCEDNDIEVGGGFIFQKENGWAFRTNAFTNGERLLIADRERAIIQDFLNKERFYCSVETCIERIIGIWNT